jgi:hypothetical protein
MLRRGALTQVAAAQEIWPQVPWRAGMVLQYSTRSVQTIFTGGGSGDARTGRATSTAGVGHKPATAKLASPDDRLCPAQAAQVLARRRNSAQARKFSAAERKRRKSLGDKRLPAVLRGKLREKKLANLRVWAAGA